MKVWINGDFYERDEAKASVFDAGFQHGVGLFETMQARNNHVFRLDDHLRRLHDSARELGLTERLQEQPLAEAVQRTVEENGFPKTRVRLTLTGGDLNLLTKDGVSQVDPTILIVAQPSTPYPEDFFLNGVTVSVSDGRLNPLDPTSGHKTLDYWKNIRALQLAGARGASESLWFSVTNHLACGSVSNIFLVRDGVLLTPLARGEEPEGGLPSPVLPGIVRRTVVEAAESLGLTVKKEMLTIDDVHTADEIFLTNSGWNVLPVVQVEQHLVSSGPGATTKLVMQAVNALVESGS
ncbi:MAG: aminotransferase class IV [Phycisphaerales bacterium]